MPSMPTVIGQFNATPLNTGFGDHALGKLGKRRVELAQPQAPRSFGVTLQKFAHKVSNLASRVLNAITPSGVRSEDKFRRGLAATSKQVGNLLGALSQANDHPVDQARVRSALAKLPEVMGPVLRRGGEYNEVLAHRLAVNLENMTPAELAGLRDGVAQAQLSELAGDEGIKSHLDLIQQAVTQEIQSRVMERTKTAFAPVLEELRQLVITEGVTRDPVEEEFAKMKSFAEDALRQYGENTDLALALVTETVSEMVNTPEHGPVPLAQFKHALTFLSSETLLELRKAPDTWNGASTFEVRHTIGRVVESRQIDAEQGFIAGATSILGREDVGTPELGELIQDLDSTMRHLGVLKSHGEIHDLVEDGQVETRLQELKPHLEKLLTEGAHDLSGLTNRELHQLKSSLKALGVTGPEKTLTAEIRKREVELEKQYTAGLLLVTKVVNSGDYAEVIAALTDFATMEDEVRNGWMQLGRKLDDPDAIYRWRAEAGAAALAGASDEELAEIFNAFQAKGMQSFGECLVDAGSRFAGYHEADLRHEALSKELTNLGTNLTRIKEKVEIEAERRGLPDLQKVDEIPLQRDLPEDARQAIKGMLGVEMGLEKGVRLVKGSVPDGALERLQTSLSEPRSGTEVEKGTLFSGEELEISTIFKRDMERGVFKIKTAEGVENVYKYPVIPKDAPESEVTRLKDEATKEALTRLKEFFGDDAEMLWAVSQYVHQGTVACFQLAMGSPVDGFIRLEDGTPVMLSGEEHKSFTFEKKPEGGFRALYHQSVDEASHYYALDGSTPKELEQDQSHFSLGFTMDIAPDKSVSTVGRPEFEYNLRPKD
ncbi:hypothetical protein [Verrucomicrobium spinosum]|uniref:hypothetical protein n=2 Tax=Verrucomicrobium spinosum TaxID=2736 RepID=UPI00017458B8|nr:hypothetical protein [Verrucomicrobium spinosum]